MGVDIGVAFQLHLYFYRSFWVDAKLSVLVEALNAVSSVTRVTSRLKDLDVFSKAPLEHTPSIDIILRNMSAVSEHAVTILLVHTIGTSATILRIWSSSLARTTLVTIVITPSTVSSVMVKEAAVTLLRECVLVITHPRTAPSFVAPLVTILFHRIATLHSIHTLVTTSASSLFCKVPPAWAASL